ncbi:MAG: hypothetical protein ABJH52_10885 [Henriciella sp.]
MSTIGLRFSIILCLAFVCLSIWWAPEASASYALEEWNMDTRNSLPAHMKIWLLCMLIANIASIAFVKNHIAARWVLGAFIVGHLWIGVFEATGIYAVQGGLVSLGHIVVWAPAIYALIKHRSEIVLPSAYGIWACIMFFFYGVSLVFDVRDAAIWGYAQLS